MPVGPTVAVPGRLTVFVVGQTRRDLEATAVVDVRSRQSAPSYSELLPKQMILRVETRECEGVPVECVIKAYLPDAVVVQATREVEAILDPAVLEAKRPLLAACRAILQEFGCLPNFDEEYTVYGISGYQGDPEVYLALHGDAMAAILKNERIQLDEEEVRATLAVSLKYGKDDLTIIDWDGAFVFDTTGEFQGDLDLFQIANIQLLRSRILDHQLDERLHRTLRLVHAPRRAPMLKTGEVRSVLREIIEIRAQSLLESAERNIDLIGDWYAARLYALVAQKFHLAAWQATIQAKLEALEDAYTMAAENFSVSTSARLELLLLGGWFLLLFLYLAEFIFFR